MMKVGFKQNYLLVACVLLLTLVCFLSINAPVRFDHERTKREQVVKQRLVAIRTAEERYKARNGTYTADFGRLIRAGLLADSLKYIPYSDRKPFALTVTTIIGKSGQQIPLMECGARYEQFLSGLDANSVANLIEEASAAGRYPGLKIGDLAQPNNNAGNWE